MARRGLDATQVVAAAANIADAEGWDAVTLARVAAELGVRPPSLYNHIAGLEDLMQRIAQLALRELADRMRRSAVGRSGRDALYALLAAYRSYILDHPGRSISFVVAFSREDPEHIAAGEEIQGVALAVVGGWGLEDEEATHAVRVIRSAAEGFVRLEVSGVFATGPVADASYERLMRTLAGGLDAWGS
jgi:AcrR family transcriptional regulator